MDYEVTLNTVLYNLLRSAEEKIYKEIYGSFLFSDTECREIAVAAHEAMKEVMQPFLEAKVLVWAKTYKKDLEELCKQEREDG
jgi:hypothetical protein